MRATNFGFAQEWLQKHAWCYRVFHLASAYFAMLSHLSRCYRIFHDVIVAYISTTHTLSHLKMNVMASLVNLQWPVSIDFMMTSSNGNIFRVTGHLCGEFTGPGEFPAQRPVTRSFDVFFDLRPNKRLSKQPWGWWFETPSWSLWRQCNVLKLATTKRFSVGVVRHTTNKWVYWKRWLHA